MGPSEIGQFLGIRRDRRDAEEKQFHEFPEHGVEALAEKQSRTKKEAPS
jgi:hypothetical protein